MKLLIKIPEGVMEYIKNNGCLAVGYIDEVAKAIMNGTPLPEHHGDLKDVDEIVKAIEDRVEFLRKNDAIFMRLRKDIDILGCIPKIRCEVPTIIPATKEDCTLTDCKYNDNSKCTVGLANKESCYDCYQPATKEGE